MKVCRNEDKNVLICSPCMNNENERKCIEMTVKELARAPNSKLSFPYISAKETKHMELKV